MRLSIRIGTPVVCLAAVEHRIGRVLADDRAAAVYGHGKRSARVGNGEDRITRATKANKYQTVRCHLATHKG